MLSHIFIDKSLSEIQIPLREWTLHKIESYSVVQASYVANQIVAFKHTVPIYMYNANSVDMSQ